MDYFAAALTGVPGVGARRLRALLTCFQSAEQVWRATEKELYASHTLPESVIQKLISYRRKTDIARIQEDMRRVGVQCVTCFESNYPMLLGQTNNPPAVLFYKGASAGGEPDSFHCWLTKGNTLWSECVIPVGKRACCAWGNHCVGRRQGD